MEELSIVVSFLKDEVKQLKFQTLIFETLGQTLSKNSCVQPIQFLWLFYFRTLRFLLVLNNCFQYSQFLVMIEDLFYGVSHTRGDFPVVECLFLFRVPGSNPVLCLSSNYNNSKLFSLIFGFFSLNNLWSKFSTTLTRKLVISSRISLV